MLWGFRGGCGFKYLLVVVVVVFQGRGWFRRTIGEQFAMGKAYGCYSASSRNFSSTALLRTSSSLVRLQPPPKTQKSNNIVSAFRFHFRRAPSCTDGQLESHDSCSWENDDL